MNTKDVKVGDIVYKPTNNRDPVEERIIISILEYDMDMLANFDGQQLKDKTAGVHLIHKTLLTSVTKKYDIPRGKLFLTCRPESVAKSGKFRYSEQYFEVPEHQLAKQFYMTYDEAEKAAFMKRLAK